MERTCKGGVMTSEGLIPLLEVDGIELIVKTVPAAESLSSLYRPPRPVVRDGKYVYALPGGGEYVEE